MNVSPGYVYLICRLDGWCRIGRTTDPKQRSRWYRSCPGIVWRGIMPIYLLKTTRHEIVEELMHTAFDEYRMKERKKGKGPRREWFLLSERARSAFTQLASFYANIFDGLLFECHGSWEVWKSMGGHNG